MLRFLILIPLLVSAALAQAEVIYVDDVLRVGVRASKDGRTKPIEVVVSGTKLEIIRRDGNYYRVRTPKGKEGWVNKAYVTTELPAGVRLSQLQENHSALQDEFDKVTIQFKETDEQNKLLSNKLAQVTLNQQQLTAARSEALDELQNQQSSQMIGWAYIAGAILLAFLSGAWLGWSGYRKRAMNRLGGLEI